MINRLRGALLYAEKRARDYLFQAVEDLLSERDGPQPSTPLIASRLGREAAARARQSAREAGFEFNNWETAGKAVINAMLNAGVLLTHGGAAVQPGITGQATVVVAVREGFRDATEAYLLGYLIRELGDVTTRDHTALAHALFRQFDPTIPREDLEDRVVVLLATLADRITLNENGVYSVVEGS